MIPGRFITFEGGEGSGKSTQIRALAALLAHHGIDCLHTREPGGSLGAETLRALVVKGQVSRWDVVSEYLLLSAARRDHLEKTIKPALMKGTWVLCDRYMDSSRVYQGLRGLDPHFMETVYTQISQGLEPDLTFVMDMDPQIGLARAHARADTENRFEQLGQAFHIQVRQAFLDLAKTNAQRYQVVDAFVPLETLTDHLWHQINQRFLQGSKG